MVVTRGGFPMISGRDH